MAPLAHIAVHETRRRPDAGSFERDEPHVALLRERANRGRHLAARTGCAVEPEHTAPVGPAVFGVSDLAAVGELEGTFDARREIGTVGHFCRARRCSASR